MSRTKTELLYTKTLSEFLQRDNNNLDLVRLILACMVIYGHSFPVTPSVGMGGDKIYQLTGLHAASIAIKGFFLISGMLVAQSLMRNGNLVRFSISRFFRIWPGLAVCVLLLAWVMGPAVTTLSLSEYFDSRGVGRFIEKQAQLQNWGGQALGYYDLPGVFENNAYPNNVNAPLWSIPAEVFCYIVLALIFAVGGFNRITATLLFLCIILDSLLPQKVIFYWIPQDNPDLSVLPFCFSLGAIFAIWQDRITIGIIPVLGAIGLSHIFKGASFGELLEYSTVFLVILFFAGMPAVNRIRLPIDISYGVYLYGWPVQQLYNQYFPNTPHSIALVTSLAGAILLGMLSAYLVERPAINYGRSLSRRFKPRATV